VRLEIPYLSISQAFSTGAVGKSFAEAMGPCSAIHTLGGRTPSPLARQIRSISARHAAARTRSIQAPPA
jgi:hypothetical protein